jgi:hypothetical protein
MKRKRIPKWQQHTLLLSLAAWIFRIAKAALERQGAYL